MNGFSPRFIGSAGRAGDTNPPGQAEVYTCRAWNTVSDSAASGLNIDAEAAAHAAYAAMHAKAAQAKKKTEREKAAV